MIKYQLKCSTGCTFEGWFRSSADFDEQKAADTLVCPLCGDEHVDKAIMAPAVSTSKRAARRDERLTEIRAAMNEAAGKARAYVEKNFDYVGQNFPEEARRIHYGETESRGIYGEATVKEAKELTDEGVSVAPLPGTPASPQKKN
ncbi:MAG: DUF1178 family protein [Pseudomonadota bacterium]